MLVPLGVQLPKAKLKMFQHPYDLGLMLTGYMEGRMRMSNVGLGMRLQGGD